MLVPTGMVHCLTDCGKRALTRRRGEIHSGFGEDLPIVSDSISAAFTACRNVLLLTQTSRSDSPVRRDLGRQQPDRRAIRRGVHDAPHPPAGGDVAQGRDLRLVRPKPDLADHETSAPSRRSLPELACQPGSIPVGTIRTSPVRSFLTTRSGASGSSETLRRAASAFVTCRVQDLQPQPFGGIHASHNGLSTGRIRLAGASRRDRSDIPGRRMRSHCPAARAEQRFAL